MVIDWRADHSFRVPRPDLTAEIGTPNACTQAGCHDDKPLQWSLDAYRQWYGQARRPHFGTTFAAARADAARGGARADPARGQARCSPPSCAPPRSSCSPGSRRRRRRDALRAALASRRPAAPPHRGRRTCGAARPSARSSCSHRCSSDPVRAVRMAAVSRLAGGPARAAQAVPAGGLRRGARRSTVRRWPTRSTSPPRASTSATSRPRLGDPAAAERYYRQALAVDDLFFPAKVNLAVLLSGQGRNDEAEQLLREVARGLPRQRRRRLLARRCCWWSRAGPRRPWCMLERAAEARPGDARVRYNLGLLLQQLGRIDEAERQLAAPSSSSPTSLDLLYALADHQLRRGRLRRGAGARRADDRARARRADRPPARGGGGAAARAVRQWGYGAVGLWGYGAWGYGAMGLWAVADWLIAGCGFGLRIADCGFPRD